MEEILTAVSHYGGRSANTLSASKLEKAETSQKHSSCTGIKQDGCVIYEKLYSKTLMSRI